MDEKEITDRIPCPRCQGKGFIALAEIAELADALALVRAGGGMTATEAHGQTATKGDCWRVGVTAINNRLKRLYEMGFLTRERHGKEWIYTARTPPKGGTTTDAPTEEGA